MLLNIILAIAVIALLLAAWTTYNLLMRIDRLEDDLEKAHIDYICADQAYKALDQGMVELTDAYETDMRQYESTIEDLKKQIAKLEANNATMLHNAKVDRLSRHEMHNTITHYITELEIAKRVIDQHDKNCLPHIVLSSMESHEKDTPLPI